MNAFLGLITFYTDSCDENKGLANWDDAFFLHQNKFLSTPLPVQHVLTRPRASESFSDASAAQVMILGSHAHCTKVVSVMIC